MHIKPFDNQNKPIVDVDHDRVPLNYFNIVKLKRGEVFQYSVAGYETCIVPATGRISVSVEGKAIGQIGLRSEDVWDAEPEGIYVPTAMAAEIVCDSEQAE
ncbi:MAG: 5-deoxy-glucuronate isomerase, partial [Reinekea sp.]